MLLVEQKSAGRDLAAARGQAGACFDALPERDRPRYQLLCDFQTFELLDRAVDRLYRRPPFASERERVEHHFGLYERLRAPLAAEAAEPKRRRRTPAAARRVGTGSRPA